MLVTPELECRDDTAFTRRHKACHGSLSNNMYVWRTAWMEWPTSASYCGNCLHTIVHIHSMTVQCLPASMLHIPVLLEPLVPQHLC